MSERDRPGGEQRIAAVGEMKGHDAASGLRCEPIGPAHVDLLVKLFERNSGAAGDSFDPFPLDAVQARSIALESHEDLYYLALKDDRPVGMSMLRGFDEGYEVPSFGIFVDGEHHGQGIGRRLTVWTIERARLRNCPAVRLSVYADNAAARGLYESLGFQEAERSFVRDIPRPREKIVMRLDLGGGNG